ncbi:cyclic nucleotide-binding/CBS domain-containing protein [Thiorhodococcus mannitoliphagus]|uniref:Cyclic nucleotide-binding/CBS domain-containing protein n=1 Tax=Thiorhodococcus mannitoliphagus TaxID=329406 RepID=A0A6P1DUD9_9GAMM|nr:putative nucleotidyltransferase substrate binding domain-containing protein [Thiorhodococcus mannitoliphagus]NEX19314.1 cyclic nucleotide-binding/CBS domain-containing protein [Thiorhodococcus mannitoliphagus]
MDVELIEIQEFLASHPPFDQLPAEVLQRLPKRLSVRYFRRGTPFPPADEKQPCLYILRRGAVELRDAEGELVGKLAEGDLCEQHCRQQLPEPGYQGKTSEDTLVYALPCAELAELRGQSEAFSEHFDQSLSSRLRKALDVVVDAPSTGTGLMTVRVRDMVKRGPITTGPETSIRDAAKIMSEHHVSSLLIMDEARLNGMITDRDLRNRCVAAGLSTDRPVREIMTEKLVSVDMETLGFQALITMTRLNVHHLPVLEDGRVAGLISSTDLTRFQSSNSVYLVGDIHRADSIDTLVKISAKVAELQVHLVTGGATASHVGQAVSAITDAITQRLIELAEAEFGSPPVPYAWVVGGSQARREQSSHSDQDNALVISDQMKPDDEPYFATLAKFVNDGLNACSFVYCPGDVMAMNPKWRQPLRIWNKYFTNWILKPEPMALMLSSVFFDLRPLHDPADLFTELQERVLNQSRANRIFIAYMAANAVKNRPPLGFFRNIVLIHGGDHDHTFDIKHRGIVPIIDLARVYALTAGIAETNTIERLQAAAERGALSKDGAANLVDALEFIGTLRIRHQAGQLRQGQKADNFLSPDELSPLERGHLKEAFLLINTMQESMGQRYQAGRFA